MNVSPTRRLRLAWGGATDQGRIRANNQDASAQQQAQPEHNNQSSENALLEQWRDERSVDRKSEALLPQEPLTNRNGEALLPQEPGPRTPASVPLPTADQRTRRRLARSAAA